MSEEDKSKIDELCRNRLAGIDLARLSKEVLNRLRTGPWNKATQLHRLAEKLEDRLSLFDAQITYENCYAFSQLLSTMSCHAQLFDLRCFGLSKSEGIRQFNKKLNNTGTYFLITQSPSGFYENAIDLWG